MKTTPGPPAQWEQDRLRLPPKWTWSSSSPTTTSQTISSKSGRRREELPSQSVYRLSSEYYKSIRLELSITLFNMMVAGGNIKHSANNAKLYSRYQLTFHWDANWKVFAWLVIFPPRNSLYVWKWFPNVPLTVICCCCRCEYIEGVAKRDEREKEYRIVLGLSCIKVTWYAGSDWRLPPGDI